MARIVLSTKKMKECVMGVLDWIDRVEHQCMLYKDDVWRFLSEGFGSALVENVKIDGKEMKTLHEALVLLSTKATENLDSQEQLGKFADTIDKLANKEIYLNEACDACIDKDLAEVKRALNEYLNVEGSVDYFM